VNERILLDGAGALGLDLDATQISSLLAYLDLIERDRERFDLTAIRDPGELTRRHVVESLALLVAIEGQGVLRPGARLVDIGSGAGAPGLTIAIARPDIRVSLVESSTTKAAWLAATCQEIGATAEVLPARAEELGRRAPYRESFDVATAKAVAPLAVLAELAVPLLTVGGLLFAHKGSRLEQEIEEAATALEQLRAEIRNTRTLPGTSAKGRLVIVAKTGATGLSFPRKVKTMRRALT
jgi:16S rRNA (guanine527-N7)-methyltransferase